MLQRLKTLRRWRSVFAGLPSLLRATRLLRSGRHGGEGNLEAATPLYLRGLSFPIYARPGTDDLLVVLEIFLQGEYQLARQIITQPVSTIVDLGTNVGCSIGYLSMIFPDANFVGIEPSPQNFAMASRSLDPLIRAQRVSLVHGFAGATPRLAVLGRRGEGGSNEFFMRDEPPGSADGIPVLTVPHLMQQHQLARIDVLKCDIEGGERELFSGDISWSASVGWIVIELHDQLSPEWLVRQLKQAGQEFQIKHVDQKGPGVCVAWLENQTSVRHS